MNTEKSNKGAKAARAALSIASGAIPFVGGILSAGAAYWSEAEQEQVNQMLKQWLGMLEDEMREKGRTIAEVVARLDMNDETTSARVESPEYQSLLKKAFRNWSAIDSESKREKIRNILANAAGSRLSSDDVVRLFIDWITTYSDFHFEVIGEVFRQNGITRGAIWQNLGKPSVREDSADADLFKMLIRDLSMGGVIRQHRPTDYHGNFVKKTPKPGTKGSGSKTMLSAFDNTEQYELTEIGKQFVHYAMTEIVAKIQFTEHSDMMAEGG